ncbi:galactitol-1-phosphate 5-dehydrogenase [Akkermansiaceae bacterium]|nr:galactitol-1-phosphate 5-dehydrogenase [bacterium]MDA7675208.1 galactitol-1-phosphate 5-dehydrogenase [Akkermansiaceae bacterium]MDA7932122.1 galactitol-1-phosphate 5-dehydrogenase [Akkermansiaceae bacterium]MDB4041731.1 galactitol-1-phosphate 5-dehydrogenase [Akkermansiaceae bacterium]MDB4143357.1 galactitol-1-phosphate 5-dehydrogenase [Akkermansiaceae bacterium]
MKVLELIAPSEFVVSEKPKPSPGAGEVLVKVACCGICGSDVHGMDNSSGRRIPPMVMGHEASGVIVELGEDVSGWNLDDRVSFDSMVFCGSCEFCERGETNLCNERQVMGVSCDEFKRDGAFAEWVIVPARILEKIPEGLGFEEAAFTEPLAVALHAVNLVKVKKGESALVVGAGLIGLLVIQALKRAGCGEIIAVDLDRGRLALAKELGASAAYHSLEDEIILPEGGVDLSMEVVGAGATLDLAIKSLRKGGRVGLVGNVVPEVKFPLQYIVTREISLIGSCAAAGECSEALEAIAAGEIQVKPLTSATVPLEEGADYFARLREGKEGLLKVLFKPHA